MTRPTEPTRAERIEAAAKHACMALLPELPNGATALVGAYYELSEALSSPASPSPEPVQAEPQREDAERARAWLVREEHHECVQSDGQHEGDVRSLSAEFRDVRTASHASAVAEVVAAIRAGIAGTRDDVADEIQERFGGK